jgi:hypothetical protein
MVTVMVIVVSFPHHGVAWHDATVLVVTALLARWWFANCPTRRGLAMDFIPSHVLPMASW